MAYYIKVTEAVASHMGLTSIRNNTADGNYLLWQADVQSVQGDTIFERAKTLGGVALTPQEAREETDGVYNPAQVYTPTEFGGSGSPYEPMEEMIVEQKEEDEVL